jgi:uncharacterized membrane protein YcaP (DUF421 family)
MFFDSWSGVLRVLVVGTLAYVALVLLLRISGKRTLSKMNAFDLVVTVSLGSTLATVLLSKSVALVEGVLAFALLVALQFVVTWFSVRSPRFQDWVKAQPSLLIFRGEVLNDVLRRERVTETELRAAVRAQGIDSFDAVDAAVLETDGTITVLAQIKGAASALANVSGWSTPGHSAGRSADDRRRRRS